MDNFQAKIEAHLNYLKKFYEKFLILRTKLKGYFPSEKWDLTKPLNWISTRFQNTNSKSRYLRFLLSIFRYQVKLGLENDGLGVWNLESRILEQNLFFLKLHLHHLKFSKCTRGNLQNLSKIISDWFQSIWIWTMHVHLDYGRVHRQGLTICEIQNRALNLNTLG